MAQYHKMSKNPNQRCQDHVMFTSVNRGQQSSCPKTAENGRKRQYLDMFTNAKRSESWPITEQNARGRQDHDMFTNNKRSESSWLSDNVSRRQEMFANTNRPQSSSRRPEENVRRCPDQEMLDKYNRSQPTWSRFEENERGWQDQARFANTNRPQSSSPRHEENVRGRQEQEMANIDLSQTSWFKCEKKGRARQDQGMFANTSRSESSSPRPKDSMRGWKDQDVFSNENRSQSCWQDQDMFNDKRSHSRWPKAEEITRGWQEPGMFANASHSESSRARTGENGRKRQYQEMFTNTNRSQSSSPRPEENVRGWEDLEMLAINNRSQQSWSRFQENKRGCQDKEMFANENRSQSSWSRFEENGGGWQDQGIFANSNRSQSSRPRPEDSIRRSKEEDSFINDNRFQSSWSKLEENERGWQDKDMFTNDNRSQSSWSRNENGRAMHDQEMFCNTNRSRYSTVPEENGRGCQDKDLFTNANRSSTVGNWNTTDGGMENARNEVLKKVYKYLGKTPNENSLLKMELERKKECVGFQKNFEARQRILAMQQSSDILKAIRTHQVVLVLGGRGSGKTTQIPQMILDNSILDKADAECCIVCVQRKKSDVKSVAVRVAYERDEPVGRSIGYHVGGDKTLPRDNSSILYCTSGILITKLENDPFLNNFNVVILDDIPKPDRDIEHVMDLLKIILPHRSDLKIILLSTPDSKDTILDYFKNSYCLYIQSNSSETAEMRSINIEGNTSNRISQEKNNKVEPTREEYAKKGYMQALTYFNIYKGIDPTRLPERALSLIEKHTFTLMKIRENYPHLISESEKEVSQYSRMGHANAKAYIQQYEGIDPIRIPKSRLKSIENRKRFMIKLETLYHHMIPDLHNGEPEPEFQEASQSQPTTAREATDKVRFIKAKDFIEKYNKIDHRLLSKNLRIGIDNSKKLIMRMERKYGW